jgi:choline-sulfatase
LATGKVPEVYGNSLLPLFSSVNPPTCWRDELHFQMNGVELYYTQRTVMTKKWKYVYNGFDFDEMYNLNEDSGENINLAFPDRYEQAGVSTQDNEYVPYPRMTMELEKVRKEMYRRMWKFARKQEDHFMYTPYITTSQAAYGPLTAFEKEQEI